MLSNHGDDLTLAHHVAFVGEEPGDAAGELGVDVDLVGLEAPVSLREARGSNGWA